MADPTPTPVEDWVVPHQDKIENLVHDNVTQHFSTRGTSTVPDPVEPGAAYSQAEANETQNAVVGILAALRTAGIIAP